MGLSLSECRNILLRLLFAAAAALIAGVTPVAAEICSTVLNNNVNVRAFGAIGDGSTDDTVSISRAVACFAFILEHDAAHSAVLYFPSGTYLLRAPVTVTERPKKIADPTRWQGVVIRGDGEKATTVKTDRPGGLIALNLPRFGGTVDISGMKLTSATAAAGSAIQISAEINGNSIPGVAQKRDLYLHDIMISGEGGGYFSYGLKTASIKRILVRNVNVSGASSVPSVASSCFDINDSYGPDITDSKCVGMRSGVVLSSDLAPKSEGQGFFITNSKFENVETAIDLRTQGSQPGGFITHNSIDASAKGIYIANKKFVFISDNDFYNNTSSDYIDIQFDEVRYQETNRGNIMGSVRGNRFHSGSANPRRTGVVLTGTNLNMEIASNIFDRFGIGIIVGAKSSGTIIIDNKFMTASPVIDRGMRTFLRN